MSGTVSVEFVQALEEIARQQIARADAAEAKLTRLFCAMGTTDIDTAVAWLRELGGNLGRIENERDEARAKLDQLRADIEDPRGLGEDIALAIQDVYSGETFADPVFERGADAVLNVLRERLAAPVSDREEPADETVAWEDLRPYEQQQQQQQQQGGYWVYPPGTDVYGNGKRWVPVKRPEEPAGETKPRVWNAGDPEPPVGTTVRTHRGHVTTRYELGWYPGPWNWDGLLKQGPLTQVERQADSEAQR